MCEIFINSWYDDQGKFLNNITIENEYYVAIFWYDSDFIIHTTLFDHYKKILKY